MFITIIRHLYEENLKSAQKMSLNSSACLQYYYIFFKQLQNASFYFKIEEIAVCCWIGSFEMWR
jgi:hypothetical protein